MYSVVFECTFTQAAFCRGLNYNIGDMDYFSSFITADSFFDAYLRAISYAEDEFPMADVSIFSIFRIS